MKIVIYGGSFNPPHCGHVEAAFAVSECLKPDKMLIIPASIPPHKELAERRGVGHGDTARGQKLLGRYP